MARTVNQGRWTAQVEGDLVVFLIGMHINKLRMIPRWLPVFRAMPRMLRELSAEPESGLLGFRVHYGLRSVLLVEYWRSMDHLVRYAHDTEKEHRPAWLAFYRESWKGAPVGFWHETYLVRQGSYEAIYGNMPPYGLGLATKLVPVGGVGESASERLERRFHG